MTCGERRDVATDHIGERVLPVAALGQAPGSLRHQRLRDGGQLSRVDVVRQPCRHVVELVRLVEQPAGHLVGGLDQRLLGLMRTRLLK